MSLRVLIADDHAVVRRGARSLRESHEGWADTDPWTIERPSCQFDLSRS
jgi:hypothetical protein